MAHRSQHWFDGGRGLADGIGPLALFALHLPLGTALFGASIALAIWAWMGRSAQTPSRAGARSVASTFGGLNMEEKLWP